MFGIGNGSKDPLVDEGSVARWLASLPPNDPMAVHAALLTELGRVADRSAKRTPARLGALFAVDAGTDALRQTLTKQYLEQAARSNGVENQLWKALFELSQAFLACYSTFSAEAHAANAGPKWQPLLPELIARQVMHHALDARTRLYRYEQWIPAKWSDLHALFQAACALEVDRKPVPALNARTVTTIEHEYLRALVLQLLSAVSLAPRNLDWVWEQLSEWCAPLRLTVEPSSLTSFYIDLRGRGGLKRKAGNPLEGSVLFLDTHPLHAMLMQSVVLLEQKLRHHPLSERSPMRGEQLRLMSKLAAQIDPEFKPLTRKGERSTAVGTVDAIVGFSRIAGFLHDRDLSPTARLEVRESSFDEGLELATFGRLRNEHARVLESARRRLANFATAGGPWEIRDKSQSGYRLVAPMSVINTLNLGTLAAIRMQGQTEWTLCLVRRMKRLTSERAEIGLQVIAHNLVGVELGEQKRGDDAYSVDGVVPNVGDRRFHGLFLSLNKRGSDTPIHTLIMPPGEYQQGKRVRMRTVDRSYPVAFGRLLERNAEWLWATLDTVDVGIKKAASAGS